jgi:hypothetical protein
VPPSPSHDNDDFYAADIEEAKRPRHWTDAIKYTCELLAFIGLLCLIGYLATH